MIAARHPSRRAALVAVAALLCLQGCRSLHIYNKPAPTVSMEERRKIYQEHQMTWHWWSGLKIGGNPAIGYSANISNPWKPLAIIPHYFNASGDRASAARAEKFYPYFWTGFALGAAGVLGASLSAIDRNQNLFDYPSWTWLAAGVSMEVVVFQFGLRRHTKPAIESFNAYLKKDLGL